MGEVIDFSAFKKGKEIKESKAGEKPSREERVNISKLTELLTLVTKLISQIPGNPRREAYQTRHDLVSSYTDDEIIGWINNFNEQEVIKRPLFYSALIEVARDRELFLSNNDR